MSFEVISSSVRPSSEVLNVCKVETYCLLQRTCAQMRFSQRPLCMHRSTLMSLIVMKWTRLSPSTASNQKWMVGRPGNKAMKTICMTSTCCPLSTVACS